MPCISVIMSVYKENKSYLKESIDSILNQTYKDFEFIIILDNPDNDEAAYLIQEYKKQDNRVRFFSNKKNIGLTASLNFAITKASGKYIARMDADDIAEANRLDEQLKYLIKNNLKFTGCSMRRISENNKVISNLTNRSYSTECITQLLKYTGDCVPHPSWFLKKEIYDELNGYRDISLCEDYDFLLRAVSHGIRIGICDKVLMNYRINSYGISQLNILGQRLTSIYLQKNLKRIHEVNQLEIDKFLSGNITEKQSQKYRKAISIFNSIVEKYKKGNKFVVIQFFKVLLISKYAFIDIRKIVLAQILIRKYN